MVPHGYLSDDEGIDEIDDGAENDGDENDIQQVGCSISTHPQAKFMEHYIFHL